MALTGKTDGVVWAEALRLPPPDTATTLAEYLPRWIARRRHLGKRCWDTDQRRLTRYALPAFGEARLDSIPPAAVALWVGELAARLAPRTARRAYGTLKALFSTAVAIDRLAPASPCILSPADLPPEEDADPGFRAGRALTPAELWCLLSDPALPPQRRLIYGLLFLAGLRAAEAAGLDWHHWSPAARPLSALEVVQEFETRTRTVIHKQKTRVMRRVPVHPLLDAILCDWRERYAAFGKRRPEGPAPLAVTAYGSRWRSTSITQALERDCARLGFARHTSHDGRRTFCSLEREAGVETAIYRRITHARPRDVMEAYTETGWRTLSDAVRAIRLAPPDAPLPASDAFSEDSDGSSVSDREHLLAER